MLKNEIYKKVPRILRTLPINVLNILNFKHNAVKAYWYDSDINFGDLLAPTLLKKYGLFPILAEKSESDIISVGSVLDSVPLDFSGYIIGSGLLHDHKRKFSKAKILAVRGKLTRERIGAPISTVLGDPGLLSDKLISRKEKSILIGIVPHYLDKCNQAIKNINHNFSKDTRIINVQRNPKDVISEIERCSYVISSSLHF
ncbi:MAG: polysaccharide pyruvyl transferase family protein, partial [Bacteroidetes bacterium]|nr:polysaccharide pyruvyl transferase family protein [Bacteroidota bacterium]